MRNRTITNTFRFLVPRILAMLVAVFWAVGSTAAAEVQMNQTANNVVEITGGSWKEAWRLRYGMMSGGNFKPHLVAGEANRAWYSYGGWLRLIDTQKGVVIGRWHYPGEIVTLTPQGTKMQVEVEEKIGPDVKYRRTFQLDPSDPRIPYWPTNWLVLYRVPIYEGQMIWPSVLNPGSAGKIPAEEAKKILPELEDAVRRDPFTPWFRVGLGRVLQNLGEPRASGQFQEAIKTPAADFTELLPISVYFDTIGENEMARAAFDLGYQDFWQKGNDPRLLTVLIDRMIIYSPKGTDWGNPATPHGRELIERDYKLIPYGEAAAMAWQLYADYLAAHGSADDARLWRQRAADSSRNTAFTFFGSENLMRTDPLILLAMTSTLAAVLYALVLYARYRPQSRLDFAARKRPTGVSRIAAFLNAHYWSRKERFAFLTIVLAEWFVIGLVGQSVWAIFRMASMPVSAMAGSLAGPVTIAEFENGFPATPQRDLILAVAYQQDGQLDKAERLYRSLPQFAESWNNLGVILKEAGRDQEAKAAFEKALEMDPKMAEAALNLGRPPGDFWTEQHQKYLPGRPMLAPPSSPHFGIALMRGPSLTVCFRALAGPFSGINLVSFFSIIRQLTG